MKSNPTNRQIKVNGNLYNPKFEGYKLNLNTDINIIHHNLPTKVDVNCVKTYSHTPFKIIEARNRLNFIFQNPWYSYSFFYIDESYSLNYIIIDEVNIIIINQQFIKNLIYILNYYYYYYYLKWIIIN